MTTCALCAQQIPVDVTAWSDHPITPTEWMQKPRRNRLVEIGKANLTQHVLKSTSRTPNYSAILGLSSRQMSGLESESSSVQDPVRAGVLAAVASKLSAGSTRPSTTLEAPHSMSTTTGSSLPSRSARGPCTAATPECGPGCYTGSPASRSSSSCSSTFSIPLWFGSSPDTYDQAIETYKNPIVGLMEIGLVVCRAVPRTQRRPRDPGGLLVEGPKYQRVDALDHSR